MWGEDFLQLYFSICPTKAFQPFARAACLLVFYFPVLFSLLGWRDIETLSCQGIPGSPWKRHEGWGSYRFCAGPCSWCPRAIIRPWLQPAGANLSLSSCKTVQSTATICPKGCINPLPHWWMTSTIITRAETITRDSVNLNKLKAFDNTMYFSGMPWFLLITAPYSPQISQQLLKAFADNEQMLW